MSHFNEAAFEEAVINLFQKDNQYLYEHGSNVHKSKTDVILQGDFKQYLQTKYANESLTITEIQSIMNYVLFHLNVSVYESNKEIMRLIADGFNFKREDKTLPPLYINLIDFENVDTNIFKIVNQLEIKGPDSTRYPDMIIYINGLPLVIFEFKSAVKENATILDAYKQITVRYMREIPDLLRFNAFSVLSDGVNNKFGSAFVTYDDFYPWQRINETDPDLEGIDTLFTMVSGLFNKKRLIDVIHNFIFFPDNSTKCTKLVCRCQQYYAAKRLLANIKKEIKPDGNGKGGTYFGATGSGKSLTMLYLTRLLMRDKSLSSPTIVLISDRNDLDKQIAGLFTSAKTFINDDDISRIENRSLLKSTLKNRTSGGVYMTTIQKFSEGLDLLSDRANIICLSDEAHRTQTNLAATYRTSENEVQKTYGFAKYLHDSFPNATYVGFSGTPIDATIETFGKVVDSYTMSDSVRDGVTVNITYEGRANKVLLDDNKLIEIEKYYEQAEKVGASEYQIEESKKAVGKLESIIGNDSRLTTLARDIITHYETRVSEGATVSGKAMIVCMTRKIAYELYKKILKEKPEWGNLRKSPDDSKLTQKELNELKPMPKVVLVITRGQDDELDLYEVAGSKVDREELDRQFKNDKSNLKIAIVVDMWLTGFDVKSLDTMYIDKPLQKHTLIQTISRVNRVYPGKYKGLIVDYFGIRNKMFEALKQFNQRDQRLFEGVEQSAKLVKDHLDILNKIFNNFNSKDFFDGNPLEKLSCLKRATEFVQTTEELEKRFMALAKVLKVAYNLCSSSGLLTSLEIDQVHFFTGIRAMIFKLTRVGAPDLAQMNASVEKMIQDAIISDGVEDLFIKDKNFKGRKFDLFTQEFLDKINRIPEKNTKIKILVRLASASIEEYKRINKIKGFEFSERLQLLIDQYNTRNDEKIYADHVLDAVATEIQNLLKDIDEDKNSFKKMGINFEEMSFYDILVKVAKTYKFYDEYIKKYKNQSLIQLAKSIKLIVDSNSVYTDWSKKQNIKSQLKVDIILKLAEYHYPPKTNDEVFKQIFEQAENFKKYNT